MLSKSRIFKIVLFSFFILFIHFTGFSWNYRGHMLTAAIAWQQLSKEEQSEVVQILMQHPDYQTKWKDKYFNELKDDMDLGLYLMMEASTWPDVIRNRENINHNWHHGDWHYINYRVMFPDNHSVDDLNGAEPDIIWAIENAAEQMKKTAIAPKEKAIYFSWLLHLMGDLHQPLHTVALFDDNVYKEGDRGGNLFYIIARKDPISLHYLWDGVAGRDLDHAKIVRETKKLVKKHPSSGTFQFGNAGVKSIAVESFEVGVSTVYLNGDLQGGAEKEDAVKLPKGYTKQLKNTGMHRITQAGYRMGQGIKYVL